MKPSKLDVLLFRIGDLAKAIGQSLSVTKLCLNGPKPNVDTISIESIATIDDAKKMMRRAKSIERKRLIARKWIGLCTCMEEIHGPFGEDGGCPELFNHDDLRHMSDALADRFADEDIRRGEFGLIFQSWKRCPRGFVEDKLTIALLEKCMMVEFGKYVIEVIESRGTMRYDSMRWIYWAFMQRMAELADPKQAKEVLDIIIRHGRFDHEVPTVALLVRKIAEDYRYY